MRLQHLLSLGSQGHRLTLEAGEKVAVGFSPRLVARLREIPEIKRLTLRER